MTQRTTDKTARMLPEWQARVDRNNFTRHMGQQLIDHVKDQAAEIERLRARLSDSAMRNLELFEKKTELPRAIYDRIIWPQPGTEFNNLEHCLALVRERVNAAFGYCTCLGPDCRGCPDCGRRVSVTSDDITDEAIQK